MISNCLNHFKNSKDVKILWKLWRVWFCLDKCHCDSWILHEGPRNLPLKFSHDPASNSWDIPDMEKYCQDKCYKKLGPKLWIIIGSVTAEIFLIWTNVARTNIAWTNVTVTVGICLRWSQEPLMFVHNRASNSWNIPDIDNCCQDKCCLDKCHCES